MANGWTAALIAPNQRVHDASQAAVTHASFGPPVLRTPSAPAPSTTSNTALASQILRDPTLGSRQIGGVAVPEGTAVGTGSVAMSGDIPPAVQAAIQNFGTNQSTQTAIDILNQVLGRFNAPAAPAGLSPVQEQYLASKTALNNQQLATLRAPQQIATQIAELESKKASMAPSPFNISPAGSYAGSQQQKIDQQLAGLYGAQTNAQRAASGWFPNY